MKNLFEILKWAGKLGKLRAITLGPVIAMGYFVAVAALEVACKILAGAWCPVASAVRQIGPLFGLSAPNFPIAELAAGVVGAIGVYHFAAKTWKAAQTERAITEIIPPDPIKGRNYEGEFLLVMMNDLGENTMVGAAKRGAELLALTKKQQAEGWNVSPPAVIAYIRQHKKVPVLTPAGLADPK